MQAAAIPAIQHRTAPAYQIAIPVVGPAHRRLVAARRERRSTSPVVGRNCDSQITVQRQYSACAQESPVRVAGPLFP